MYAKGHPLAEIKYAIEQVDLTLGIVRSINRFLRQLGHHETWELKYASATSRARWERGMVAGSAKQAWLIISLAKTIAWVPSVLRARRYASSAIMIMYARHIL